MDEERRPMRKDISPEMIENVTTCYSKVTPSRHYVNRKRRNKAAGTFCFRLRTTPRSNQYQPIFQRICLMSVSVLCMADLEDWHETFRLYMALSLTRKVLSGVNIYPLNRLSPKASAIYKRETSGRTGKSAIYRRDRTGRG